MITLDDYYMGRNIRYPRELGPELIENAQHTVETVNALLEVAAADGVTPAINPDTGTHVSSGWRPRGINDATANAAIASKHITCQAVDLRDHGDRSLARWCLKNLHVLEEQGLYMENPQWTPTWVHLQTIAPRSGRRVYVPSTAPALCAALPEQAGLA